MGGEAPKTSKKTRIGPKRKIAFVCSGGGTKAGAFHLGVALALQERGFRFRGGLKPDTLTATQGSSEISIYVGSSAGSIISSYLAAGYSLNNIFQSFLGEQSEIELTEQDREPRLLPGIGYNTMFRLRPELAKENLKQILSLRKMVTGFMQGQWDYLFKLKWLKMSGMFSTGGLEDYLRDKVLESDSFKDYAADLFIVATQLNHSKKVVFGKYHYKPPPHDPSCIYRNDVPISKACAASMALPIIYSPYPIKSQKGKTRHYIDGEFRDTLSSHVATDAGADLVFASHTHQPYHYTKEIGSLVEHGLPAILIQSAYLMIEQKINAHIYNNKIHGEAISAVSDYCKENGVSEKHRKKLCELLEGQLNHRADVDTIYIHPQPDDAQMFIHEHFSLAPKKLAGLVTTGFKSATDVLRRFEFEDCSTQSK